MIFGMWRTDSYNHISKMPNYQL